MTHFQSLNPATGEVVADHRIFTKDEVDSAVRLAQKGFMKWGMLSFSARKKVLLSWKDEISSRFEDFAQLISAETG